MFRILLILLIVIACASGITYVSSFQGGVEARIGDTIYYTPVSVLIGAIVMCGAALIAATLFLRGAIALPGRIKQRAQTARRQQGMLALTRGLEAVAAGDATDAQRHAKLAVKQLEEPSLTRLLTAQAAQLAGDEDTAKQSFSAMLEAPETEFLGLRGLYLQALAAGDKTAAQQFADRAFKLRPNAAWAFDSVYQLSIERGGWGDAREALRLAAKNTSASQEDKEKAKRRKVALATAAAYSAQASGDITMALKEVEEALKTEPGFAPAATLAADLYADKGNKNKATKVLEAAFAVDPHPGLSKVMERVWSNLPAEKLAEKLRKFVERAPYTDETRLVLAEQHIRLSEWEKAKGLLEPLMAGTPRARAFSAMASAIKGLYGDDAARPWLDKAASAPLDPLPGAYDGTFHFTTDGWRRLVEEYGDYGRLMPPPLEEARTGLTQAEVKLLTAPPQKEIEEIIAAPVVTSEETKVETEATEKQDVEAEAKTIVADTPPTPAAAP